MPTTPVKIIECPRDAMQGISHYIPLELKADYLNVLLQVGFDTIDFGSFVSPKAIPQLKDTAEVLARLDLGASRSKLLAIVANVRGAEAAATFPEISYLGFPFSISETFQQRNTHSSLSESLRTVEALIACCARNQKIPVIYLSMGFGNPYGDPWSAEIAAGWTAELIGLGATVISLSDTVGVAKPDDISSIFSMLTARFPGTEFGVHLHSRPDAWEEKVAAAYAAGCRRFDGAAKGYGGCPMAGDALTGNIATENLLDYFSTTGEIIAIDVEKWRAALALANRVFAG